MWSPETSGGTIHGSWVLNNDRHIGDLCNNVAVNSSGISQFTYYYDLISLYQENENCIVGRSLIIHEKPDDKGFVRTNKNLIMN